MAVFGLDQYTNYVYKGDAAVALVKRGRRTMLRKGARFAVRFATSKPDTVRLVLPGQGPTIIYSLSTKEAFRILRAAKPVTTLKNG